MWEILIEICKITLIFAVGFAPLFLLAWWIGATSNNYHYKKRMVS